MILVSCETSTRHPYVLIFFFFNDTATTEIYTLSLHDALPIYDLEVHPRDAFRRAAWLAARRLPRLTVHRRKRSEEHTSELQSQSNLVCRLLLEKKKKTETSSSPWQCSTTAMRVDLTSARCVEV